jgi:rhodanese-related sulfurtransferase/glyoxylase-like metal-dependent hydrolase (beta-lactamase superfamily II)
MEVVQFVHEGLGNSSYLVRLQDGLAALIDPDRSVGRYLRAAADRGWEITAVFETHLHADFVSGAVEAASATSARMFLPEDAHARFPHEPLRPGLRMRLPGIEVEPIASPGHTPEHLSYALYTEGRSPTLFSGGSLIVGGAARTDLIAPDQTDALTRAQFRTLKSAFAHLDDHTLLMPTHGGGSFCSTGSGDRRTSTLGHERAANPLLGFEDEGEFARHFTAGFPATPAYFSRMRPINQAGPRLRRDISLPPPMPPQEFAAAQRQAIVVDVRSVARYMAGHIPGALSIAFRDSFAVWLGWLVPQDKPLLFVLDGVALDGVLDQALLVGCERFAGWLDGGMRAWADAGLPTRSADLVKPAQVRKTLADGALALDVREPDEFRAGHVPGALHIPLGSLGASLPGLPHDRPIVTYCGHGERAATALSVLERAGFGPLLNLRGGFDAWREAGYKVAR